MQKSVRLAARKTEIHRHDFSHFLDEQPMKRTQRRQQSGPQSGMQAGGLPRSYSPLPWIDEWTNLVYLETGARKTAVLALGILPKRANGLSF